MKFKLYHTFTKLPASYGRLASLPYLDMLPQHFVFPSPTYLLILLLCKYLITHTYLFDNLKHSFWWKCLYDPYIYCMFICKQKRKYLYSQISLQSFSVRLKKCDNLLAENLTGSEMGNLKKAEELEKQPQTGMQDREEGKTRLPPLFLILSLVQRCVPVPSPHICERKKRPKV